MVSVSQSCRSLRHTSTPPRPPTAVSRRSTDSASTTGESSLSNSIPSRHCGISRPSARR